ncbi:MAG: hypothetical protein R3Y23_04555 [Bacillota bacterium]
MIKITANKIIIALLILAGVIDTAFAIGAGTVFILVAVGKILMFEWFWQLALYILIANGVMLFFALILFIGTKMSLKIVNQSVANEAMAAAKRTSSADYSKQLAKQRKR